MMRGWWRIQKTFGLGVPRADTREPTPSRGSWDQLDSEVLVVCHPNWRGVRTAAYAHGEPVVEVADAARWADHLVTRAAATGVRLVVLHGVPPGTERLAEALRVRGIACGIVLHSSMAQHGAEAGEARVADMVFGLLRRGIIDRLGFVKEGMAEAFAALGAPAAWVPNRSPRLPQFSPMALPSGLNIGVFAEPFWRKNVVTQLGAVALLERARAHVLVRPPVRYLEELEVVEHGVVGWEKFVQVQGSVDLNLYVTLSECYPLSPLESYLAGVPCLVSRTSSLFRDDRQLWELTTVEVADDPRAVATAAERLLANDSVAVTAARAWIARWDERAESYWQDFIASR